MDTTTQNQIPEVIFVAVYPQEAAATNHCTNCKTELLVNNNVNYTNFGLSLCSDCLYS
ncbi:MAG: hypothetical protein ACRYFA_01890 [Janthinobacterium lividum]